MATPVTPRHNLHSVYMHGGHGLGIECQGCRHRAIAFDDGGDAFKGNMNEIWRMRFRCSACGMANWQAWLLSSAEEPAAFLDGTLVVSSPMDGGRPSF